MTDDKNCFKAVSDTKQNIRSTKISDVCGHLLTLLSTTKVCSSEECTAMLKKCVNIISANFSYYGFFCFRFSTARILPHLCQL